MRNFAPILFLNVIVIFLFSCSDNTVYHEYIAIENSQWHKDNVATFEFEATDTLTPHNFYISIRNKGDYPYSNLYLFVTINGPSGDFARDTVNCIIADNRGKWKRSEEHTSELQSRENLVCRLLLEKKKK